MNEDEEALRMTQDEDTLTELAYGLITQYLSAPGFDSTGKSEI